MFGGHADHGGAYVLVVLLFVLFATFVLAGLYAFLQRRYRDAFFSRLYDNAAWIALPAVIESARVEQFVPSGESGPRFSVDIKYRYEYGGASYVASTISRSLHDFAAGGGVPPEHADRLKNLLPVGTQVTAYVDTLNPSTATLSIQDAMYGGKTKAVIYLLLVLSLFSMFGVVSFLFGIAYLWSGS